MITWLQESEDPEDVGGKAASLGKLMRAGISVPDGFVLHGNWTDTELFQGYQQLCKSSSDHRVAIRSSSTHEDGLRHSFAGLHDSFLNIQKETLLDAVAACSCSLRSDRVKAYRSHHKIANASADMAILVQKMVQAIISGVTFTCDPVDGNPGITVIDVVPGNLDKLVSGLVTPWSHTIYQNNDKVVIENPRPPEKLPIPVDIQWLANLGGLIEGLFGDPQDIEWAIDGGRHLWVLQSRPVTTVQKLS